MKRSVVLLGFAMSGLVVSARAYLDDWLAKRETEKSRYIGSFCNWVKSYREWVPREGELMAAEENVRARLNVVRPAVSRMTITRIS